MQNSWEFKTKFGVVAFVLKTTDVGFHVGTSTHALGPTVAHHTHDPYFSFSKLSCTKNTVRWSFTWKYFLGKLIILYGNFRFVFRGILRWNFALSSLLNIPMVLISNSPFYRLFFFVIIFFLFLPIFLLFLPTLLYLTWMWWLLLFSFFPSSHAVFLKLALERYLVDPWPSLLLLLNALWNALVNLFLLIISLFFSSSAAKNLHLRINSC